MSQPDETFHDEGDDVIEEIRAIRHRMSERFGHDPVRLLAYLREKQEQHRDRLLRAEPTTEVADKNSGG
jgi:hypothetical protein